MRAKNSVLPTFVIALLHPVCQKPLWHSLEQMSRYYDMVELTIEMRLLSLYLCENHRVFILRIASLLFPRITTVVCCLNLGLIL